jgi:energy-coupling factor transport system permease protein
VNYVRPFFKISLKGEGMDRFSKLHPVMHLLFFVFTFIIVLSINNPFFSVISLVCALLYEIKLIGRQMLSTLKFVIVITAVVSLMNMLFVHYGETTLFTVKNIDFTLETLFYGFNQGMILSSVMVWFGIFSRVFDSERIIYMFRFAPKSALIFSMVLGFIPRFVKKLDDVRDAKLALNGGVKSKGLKNKFKDAMNELSALITYSLESSIITADSMEARGYNPKVVRAGRFKFMLGDIILIFLILITSLFVIVQKLTGNISFVFNPQIKSVKLNFIAVICFVILELIPLGVDFVEDILWKKSNA